MNIPWYQCGTTDMSQILSSRVRLARNIKKYPFQKKLTDKDAAAMVLDVKLAVSKEGATRMFHQLNIQELGETEQNVFLEKHIVSPEFLRGTLPKGLLVSDDQNVSVMVNEEDHLRIQSVYPGDGLATAFETANEIDDLIEESLEFAFHSEYGYLTACPTNIGTGLRASYMIHLPCLELSDQLKKIAQHIATLGITLRGIYGEGTAPMGSIYQISNQRTLGKTEEDIITTLQNVTKDVINHENHARDNFLATRRNYLEDKVCRSHGLMSCCRIMTTQEAMGRLSDIRLGYLSGLLDAPKPAKPIYQIMMGIGSGHLQRIAGKDMNDQERDIARATYLREVFTSK